MRGGNDGIGGDDLRAARGIFGNALGVAIIAALTWLALVVL